jgi:hypothetical protein
MTHTGQTEWLCCGCQVDNHNDTCHLGQAETVAMDAIANAAPDDGHPLIIALVAVTNAGLLRPLPAGDPGQSILFGLLDELWNDELLGPVTS